MNFRCDTAQQAIDESKKKKTENKCSNKWDLCIFMHALSTADNWSLDKTSTMRVRIWLCFFLQSPYFKTSSNRSQRHCRLVYRNQVHRKCSSTDSEFIPFRYDAKKRVRKMFVHFAFFMLVTNKTVRIRMSSNCINNSACVFCVRYHPLMWFSISSIWLAQTTSEKKTNGWHFLFHRTHFPNGKKL